MISNDNATLYTLGDRGPTIEGSANDVRGREVKDKGGHGIGKFADLLVDHGGFLGFGETKTLIPVGAITKITQDEIVIDQSRDRFAAPPGYVLALADDRPYHSSIYSYYGRAPYWGRAPCT